MFWCSFLASLILVALVGFSPSIGYNLDILNTLTFTPFDTSDHNQLFGYSVSTSQKHPNSFLVGAPKNHNGLIYNCSLIQKHCQPVDYTFATEREEINKRNEMFGASIVQLEDGNIITCSPSYKDSDMGIPPTYKEKGKYASGECYMGEGSHLIKMDLGMGTTPMYNGKFSSACGQQGTSINKHNNDVVFGAPGYYNWKGNIIVQRIINSVYKLCQFDSQAVNSEEYSYYGYSVAALKIGNETCVALGGPREDLHGGVVIWWLDGCSIKQKRKIESTDFASYFGSSLARIDIESDGTDELVVGIPFYNQSIGDEGKVEIYKLQNDKWVKVSELNGQTPFSRFGSVVYSPGDVDHDGHQDLLISAPEEDEGKVYLYYGKDFKKFQKISAGKVFSFEAFIRPDGYPNIFFGKGEENQVTMYKSRPVHNLRVNIQFEDNFIYWNPVSCVHNETYAKKIFKFRVFYVRPPEDGKNGKTKRNRVKNLRYEIVLDKRGYVEKRGESVKNTKSMGEKFEGILSFETSDDVSHSFDLIFPFKKTPESLDKPIQMFLSLHESDKESGPMLSPNTIMQYPYNLTFQRKKSSDRPTLIKEVLVDEKIPYDIGFHGKSIVKGLLINEGEAAFDTSIMLSHPSWAVLKSVSTNVSCFKIDCKRTWGTTVGYAVEKCNCPEALTETTLEIYFHFEHSVVDSSKMITYDFNYGAAKATFVPHYNSTLTAFNASLDSSLLHKVPIGYSFSTYHFYDIRNNLTHPQFEIEVYEPFSAFNNDLCCLDTEISVIFKKGKSEEIIKPVNSVANNSASLSAFLESSLLRSSLIKLLSFGNEFWKFSIPYLHHDQSIDVTIKNNISGELLEKLQKFSNFSYHTNLLLKPAVVETSRENFLSGSYKKEFLLFEVVSYSSGSIPTAPTPYWLIILCIVVGLVVVLILVLILKKLGFFKRKKHEMLIVKRRESKRLSQRPEKDLIENSQEENN